MISLTELIGPRIHQSDIYGIFIEIGAGQPVTEQLYQVTGASKTIHTSLSPYSCESQIDRYGPEIETFRSVSVENVCWILRKEQERLQSHNQDSTPPKPVNLIWVSSFQLKNPTEGISHGWIGYRYRSEPEVYVHLTFPRSGSVFSAGSGSQDQYWSRKKVMQMIGAIGLRLLWDILKSTPSQYKYVDGYFQVPVSGSVDPVGIIDLKKAETGQRVVKQIQEEWMMNHRGYQLSNLIRNPDIYWVVNATGQWERLEKQFRTTSERVIIYKGSFNPIHEGHLAILNETQCRYPRSPIGLMISMNTYQKSSVNGTNLRQLVDTINQAGYSVILTEKGMFQENIRDLEERLPGQHWLYLVGWDTFTRMELDLFLDYPLADYLVFDRHDGFSNLSTEQQNKLQKLTHCQFVNFQMNINSSEIREK